MFVCFVPDFFALTLFSPIDGSARNFYVTTEISQDTQFPIGAWLHYFLPPYFRERKTTVDNRDSPIVNFAQLATDSRGRRRRVEGKKDQCLQSKL